MHTAVLLDNACLENLSSNLLVIYDAHIKPHTCVKELSFQLNWNWEPPWSLGCLCCWKSWSLPHYLKEGKKAQCPNRIKQTVEQSSLVMQKHWLIPASVKMWVLQNYVSFFWPLPVEVSTADHPLHLSLSLASSCHTNPLHVHRAAASSTPSVQYIHYPPSTYVQTISALSLFLCLQTAWPKLPLWHTPF